MLLDDSYNSAVQTSAVPAVVADMPSPAGHANTAAAVEITVRHAAAAEPPGVLMVYQRSKVELVEALPGVVLMY